MRFLPALIAVSVVVSACGGDDGEASATTTLPVPSGQIDLSLDPVELSPDYPGEVPIPAGLILLGSEVLDGETTTIFEITGWHAGVAVEVGSEYEAVLEQRGFEITNRNGEFDKLFFNGQNERWFVSAGFFPDPVRLEGTSVGITVVPVGATTAG